VREWLRLTEKEQHIVVVSHGTLPQYLTEDRTTYAGKRGSAETWSNAEFRTYVFDESKPMEGTCSLVETWDSLSWRMIRHESEHEETPAEKANKSKSVKLKKLL
jgi:hypothetical protein